MNKQSNTYTIIYIIVLVVVVGTALALTSISLKDRQTDNANADKMRQILASVGIEAPAGKTAAVFDSTVTSQIVVDINGTAVDTPVKAFDVDVARQSKEAAAERLLPVYVATLPDGATKYILPLYGAGLWGPIWGYIAVDADGSTVYGAYFAHQGETPGLGAEIEKPAFSDRFKGKRLMLDGHFAPIAVVKAGMPAPEGGDAVDGVSGGTITSKGVGAMIDNCLAPYAAFLSNLHNNK